ncbi:MAG TPA: DUF2797 domain-containing protein [Magnetospirillum sp.]|nr:DUF2797 domain-containing protein [Magnetospirillum sp.]
MSLRRMKARYCVGRYDLDTFKDESCPLRAKLTGPDDVCPDCFRAIGFNPAFYNARDRISDKQLRYNRLPHVVYLAWFGPGILKVGISSRPRAMHRLLGQGARAAAIIAEASNAEAARAIEAKAVKHPGIRETVRTAQKIAGFEVPMVWPDAVREMMAMAAQLEAMVPGLTITPAMNLEGYYGDCAIDPFFANLTDSKPLELEGTCVGLAGAVMIGRSNARGWVVDTHALTGHLIELRLTNPPEPA